MEFEITPFALPEAYTGSVLSLADLKEHLRVDSNDEDDYIGFCRDAAVGMVEAYCGVYLAAREGVVWKAEALPARIDLGVWPLVAISSISWLDSEGNAQTGEADDWRIVSRGDIALKPGRVLPTGVAAGVEITFDAGFTDATRPAVLVRAAKIYAAHLYYNREGYETGVMSGDLPPGFTAPLKRAGFRIPVI